MQFFRVRNFERYQHYHDRKPPWIKLYRDLWLDPTFARLSHVSKLFLVGFLTIASETENRIPYDPAWIRKRLAIPLPIDFRSLLNSQFIEPIDCDASAMLASAPESHPSRCRVNAESTMSHTLVDGESMVSRCVVDGESNEKCDGTKGLTEVDASDMLFESKRQKYRDRNTETEVQKVLAFKCETGLHCNGHHAECTEAFTSFWNAYPRHDPPRKQTRLKWCAQFKAGLEIADLLAWIERAKARWTEKKYIPQPTTWINQRRWEGDLPPEPRQLPCKQDAAREKLQQFIDTLPDEDI